MRDRDMEWVELGLKPLKTALERLDLQINATSKKVNSLSSKFKTMKGDIRSNTLAVDQACNSARSLLQQANRKIKEANKYEDDEEILTEPTPESTSTESPAPRRTETGRGVI